MTDTKLKLNLKLNLRRLLIAFGLVVLGGSIGLNLLLFHRAKQYYVELNQTRLDPVGLSYYPVTPAPQTDSQPIRVVFFGDSRAASWIAPDIEGYEFINRGIGSQTSVQTIQRFDEHVRPLQPDVIVIQVGINDLKAIALFPDLRASIVANCRTNIQRIVEESRNLGAVVIVTTIIPAGEVALERRPFWSDEIDRAVQEVNASIATLAGDQILILDTFTLLADRQGKVLSDYRKDDLHINDRGYAVLNQELVRLLQTLLQE